MGLFDFLKKPKKEPNFDGWHAETDIDKFSGIEQSDIESYLSRISDGIYEFVILTLPEAVNGCGCMMACKDGGSLRMEISVDGETAMKKIYGKGGLTYDQALTVITDIAGPGKLPDIDEWDFKGNQSNPKSIWLEMKPEHQDIKDLLD